MRVFKTSGPVYPDKHYAVPPLERLDLDDILSLVRDEEYFVLHAPRQTGKTTALWALRDLLNEGAAGDLRCVYANLEVGEAGSQDTERAMRAILAELSGNALLLGDRFPQGAYEDILARAGPDMALKTLLMEWAGADSRPLVLLLDEVDALYGATLLSVLRQLRAGYGRQPSHFPQSVVLCGLRDVRDYRLRFDPDKPRTDSGSPFNIKAESLRLGDFNEAQIRALYAQHTEDTGQEFEPAALEAAWEQTQGQPWLVNALARQACFRNKTGRDRSRRITAENILEAREALILRRDTHLDQLAAKLQEDRVRRVIEPMLSGGRGRATQPDIQYVRDLGLIARDAPTRIANPIYREVVPRELSQTAQEEMTVEPAWYVAADGSLDVPKLLAGFQEYFRENSEHWMGRFDYAEAGPQLLLQAYCHRVVNSGGRIEREYATGRGRMDLLLEWPRGEGRRDRFVVECKVLHRGQETTEREGLEQTAAYMDRSGATAGHLVVFDRDRERSWREKIYRREAEQDGFPITIWGM